jgi:hypothetical protein
MLPSQALLLLCYLASDLVIITILCTCSTYTYDLHKPYLGGHFFSQSHGTPVWPWPVILSIYSM